LDAAFHTLPLDLRQLIEPTGSGEGACSKQLTAGPLGERRHAHFVEHLAGIRC
jgi:hypothetical protein